MNSSHTVRLTFFTFCLTVTTTVWGASPFGTENILTASDASDGSEFGQAVAISGNRAIVGSRSNAHAGESSGAAYLFDVGTSNEAKRLIADDASADDQFGFSVGISDNLAIVGAFRDDEVGENSGSAYLFDVHTGNQLRKLLPDDGATDDLFGSSVAVDGDYAIVGANWDNNQAGSAYIFDITTGNQLFKLSIADGQTGDGFGYCVALSGGIAIVGAHGEDDAGLNSGAAYLFDVATGQQLFKLTASDAAPEDTFGVSVGISGNLAIVGAPLDDDNGFNSGSAYVFDVATGTQLMKLLPSDFVANDDYNFGISVSVSSTTAIVGADADKVGDGNYAGSAYLFDAVTGNQILKLLPSDSDGSDHFGYSVGISGQKAIVGAPDANEGNIASGKAYLFVPETSSVIMMTAACIISALCRSYSRDQDRLV